MHENTLLCSIFLTITCRVQQKYKELGYWHAVELKWVNGAVNLITFLAKTEPDVTWFDLEDFKALLASSK